MIGIDTEDLTPSLAARVFDIVIYSPESLVDLLVDLGGEDGFFTLGIPSAFRVRPLEFVLGRGIHSRFLPTLTGAVDRVSDSDSLAV